MFGNCCPSGRDSSLNLLVLVFVSGAISLSHVDEAVNVLDLSVVDIIFMCPFPSSPSLSTCSCSDLDFYVHQLIPVAFVVIHGMY